MLKLLDNESLETDDESVATDSTESALDVSRQVATVLEKSFNESAGRALLLEFAL